MSQGAACPDRKGRLSMAASFRRRRQQCYARGILEQGWMPMQFYRRLHPVKAISFDLDDTLYNNKPVLLAAEARLMQWLAHHSRLPQAGERRWWWQQRAHQLRLTPELRHDTTRLRHRTLERGLLALGLSDCASAELADGAMANFLEWRNEIVVSDEVRQVIQRLARRCPLAAITNGNADLARFWPQAPFVVARYAGQHGPMKPDPSLFEQTWQRLGVAPAQLLHIGDHPNADVAGANRAGCQSGWLTPPYEQAARPLAASLPTFAFQRLSQLLQLPL
ncbi:HAD-IA family hydrolase [Ferrimonas kyonanensis]|uniref:HAD-IA family hydrolase n=1 Tax=Ferrimonas kyonanensis TaxID=364763 RepID=UPI000A046717|nr:HAD-IA family hydrolase [Ferrimonas kyonanensis]